MGMTVLIKLYLRRQGRGQIWPGNRLPPPHPHLETFVLASGPGLFLVSVNLVARGIFTVPRGLVPLIQNHFHFVSYSI